MSDFLWDCALEPTTDGRNDVIPDYEDDMCHFGSHAARDGDPDREFYVSACARQEDIAVQIIEEREHGVLDIIGGELWEGALLMCAHILLHQLEFLSQNVLELGCGVGLPGLLLAHLKRQLNETTSIMMSDNDYRVVNNLNESIQCQFPCLEAQETRITIRTKQLDWSIFSDGLPSSQPELESSRHPAVQVLRDTTGLCEVIMGCELCYAPYHGRCLAALLRAYLSLGLCQKVVIVQMRDREGFATLLTNLETYGISYNLEEISQEVYDVAQQVQCVTDPQHVSLSESGGGSSKQYVFSRALLDAVHSSRTVSTAAAAAGAALPGNARGRTGLLRTDRDNFVLLTITRRGV